MEVSQVLWGWNMEQSLLSMSNQIKFSPEHSLSEMLDTQILLLYFLLYRVQNITKKKLFKNEL